jgi:hypothetical protein
MDSNADADRSKAPSSQRLRLALERMAKDDGEPTAVSLCERAGISRNALYRYHPEVVRELHKLQRQWRRAPSPSDSQIQRLREDNDALKSKVAALVALVDHYFAAWSETSVLLKRREREMATLRKLVKPKVVPMRSNGIEPRPGLDGSFDEDTLGEAVRRT